MAVDNFRPEILSSFYECSCFPFLAELYPSSPGQGGFNLFRRLGELSVSSQSVCTDTLGLTLFCLKS